MSDTRIRVYHTDSRRTYKEYQPFKTLTVRNLINYQEPKELLKLSKYGGNIKYKEEATGFFYVKKIADCW